MATSISIHSDKPSASINLPYPVSSNLVDIQEFETKTTMSGIVEYPKNSFSENKKWVLTWENLTREQLTALENAVVAGEITMVDPLGRTVLVKGMDFKPSLMRGVQDNTGRMMYGAVVELLVQDAVTNLFVPDGSSGVVSTSNTYPELSKLLTGSFPAELPESNLERFGPLDVSELDNPPEDWDRSAREGISTLSTVEPTSFSSFTLSQSKGSVFFAFTTSSI